MPVDYENDLILLTCASGKQCAHLLPLLSKRFKRLRLAVHSESSRDRLQKEYPTAEVLTTDLSSPPSCHSLLSGVSTLFYIAPPFHPHESHLGLTILSAARNTPTLRHFIHSSVLHPFLSKLLNHTAKLPVEEALIESGLNWTILQPTHVMEMFPLLALAEQEKPVYPAHWTPSVPFSFLSLYDFAEVGMRVVEEREGHYFASYPLCSTLPMPYTEFVAKVSKVLGKEIEIQEVGYKESCEGLVKGVSGGMEVGEVDAGMRDSAERMILYYERRGLWGSPNVLRWLIGREPMGVEEWARRKLAEAKDGGK